MQALIRRYVAGLQSGFEDVAAETKKAKTAEPEEVADPIADLPASIDKAEAADADQAAAEAKATPEVMEQEDDQPAAGASTEGNTCKHASSPAHSIS